MALYTEQQPRALTWWENAIPFGPYGGYIDLHTFHGSGGHSSILRGDVVPRPGELSAGQVLVKRFNIAGNEPGPFQSLAAGRYNNAFREYQIMSDLNRYGVRPRVHAFIAQYPDQPARNNYVYMVMDEVPGKDLQFTIGTHRYLSPTRAVSAVESMLNTLHLAHESIPGSPWIHGDVKSSNLILADDGNDALIDWTIARTQGEIQNSAVSPVALGTYAYSAPENMRPRSPWVPAKGVQIDIYSAGITLFEALYNAGPGNNSGYFHADLLQEKTGVVSQPEFVSSTLALLEYLESSRHSEDLGSLLKQRGVSDELIWIVQKATAINPDDRFRSALEMHQALERARRRYSF